MKNLLAVLLIYSSAFAADPAPYDYQIHKAKFESIFIQHPKCAPERMEWSQMECSNFKARASKRFSKEWGAHSYWDGHRVIDNPEADQRVNAEIWHR